MFDKILKEIQAKIGQLDYVMTLHADEEMEADNLSILDIEQAIFTGQILERQRDRLTAESKYRIRGYNIDENAIEVIVKLSPTGKIIIITVYAL
jgi:hypothetical protein